MLEVKNLNVIFNGNNHVLNNINFSLEKGEILGLIGLSGAGKSSLLRSLNLLRRPETGEIIFNGKDLLKLSKKELIVQRRKIGVVFQGYNLLERRNVRDNILLPFEISGNEPNFDLFNSIVKTVGLEDKTESFPNKLSGGEKQRTAIARALINNPEIILFDEPTSALDPGTTSRILELIDRINKEYGISVIIVTHEMEVVKKVCDRVLYLKNGSNEFTGEVKTLFIDKEKELLSDFYSEFNACNILDSMNNVYKIYFYGENTYKSVISELSREYNVNINILSGKIDRIKNTPYGSVTVEINFKTGENMKFYEELRKRVYKVERIK
ncbi:MAG: methionine ABC transporter ATP-binding protein [Thermotogae bacterium]|nr:methionine ABC transporter ATP-binding protein [Thermotogota bacterium]